MAYRSQRPLLSPRSLFSINMLFFWVSSLPTYCDKWRVCNKAVWCESHTHTFLWDPPNHCRLLESAAHCLRLQLATHATKWPAGQGRINAELGFHTGHGLFWGGLLTSCFHGYKGTLLDRKYFSLGIYVQSWHHVAILDQSVFQYTALTFHSPINNWLIKSGPTLHFTIQKVVTASLFIL